MFGSSPVSYTHLDVYKRQYLLLGVPGMLAYKMVNTLDSMVGYKNERYRRFGCFAARLDAVSYTHLDVYKRQTMDTTLLI